MKCEEDTKGNMSRSINDGDTTQRMKMDQEGQSIEMNPVCHVNTDGLQEKEDLNDINSTKNKKEADHNSDEDVGFNK